MDDVKNAKDELDNALSGKEEDPVNKAFNGYKEKVEALKIEFQRLNKEIDDNNRLSKMTKSADTLYQKIIDWTKDDSKTYKKNRQEIDNIIDSLKHPEGLDESKLKDLENKFNDISKAEQRAKDNATGLNKVFGSLGVTIKDAAKSFLQSFISQQVRKFLSDMVSTVKELDSAMIELKKVTDLSEQGYEK